MSPATIDAQEGRASIWNALFIKVTIINMMVHICTYMMNTLSGMYADYLGASVTIVGLVSGLFASTALLLKLVSAPAIDAFDRKIVLAGSVGIVFLSFVGYALSKSIPMMIVSRLLTGAGLAFIPTCCMTIASDSLPNDKIITGIGFFSLGTAICQALAPSIGLALVGRIGYSATFASLAAFMLLTIAFTLTVKTNYVPTKKFSLRIENIIAKEAFAPTLIVFLLGTTASVINAFLVLYGNLAIFGSEQVAHSEMGLFFTVYAVTMIFSRPMIGKLADKFGPVRVVLPSMICFASAFFLISVSRSLVLFLIAGFISAFGYGGCQPALVAVCMKSVPRERRGAASCTSYIGSDIGNLIGPVVAGAVVTSLGAADRLGAYSSMWRIMIIPVGLAMIAALLFRDRLSAAARGR